MLNVSIVYVIPVCVFRQPLVIVQFSPCVSSCIDCVSNSSHPEPRLVCLAPCVYIPQSVQTPAVRKLIIYSVPIVCKPVYLRFYTTPLWFWFFESALSFWLSAHLILGFLTSSQLSSLFTIPACPFCTSLSLIFGFGRGLVFDHSFVCHFVLWISEYLVMTFAWINNDFCICPGLHLAPFSDVTLPTTSTTAAMVIDKFTHCLAFNWTVLLSHQSSGRLSYCKW